MKPALRWSMLAALCLLSLLGVLLSQDNREFSPTTLGAVPPAYGALFDLLAELGVPVSRTYALPQTLPADATVWWIAPESLCGPQVSKRDDATQRTESESSAGDAWSGLPWLQAGGTAVVFLKPRNEHAACESIAGVALPQRVGGYEPQPTDTTAEPADKNPEAKHRRGKRALAEWFQTVPTRAQELAGRVSDKGRRLETAGLASFENGNDWEIAASLDGRPFVLERRVGSGRLVVAADAAVLRNAWLDHADNAPFALDLVRAYGTPRFDERDHGLRIENSAVRYIASSSALPLFLGLTLLGLFFVWRAQALPGRVLTSVEPRLPSLETFVESLAALYTTTRDYGRVCEQYRELTAARLRRHFGLPPETPRQLLLERLRTRRVSASALEHMTGDRQVDNAAGLQAAVRALDELVREAVR